MRKLKYKLRIFITFLKAEKQLTLLVIIGMIICNLIFMIFTNNYFVKLIENNQLTSQPSSISLIFENAEVIDDIIERLQESKYVDKIIVTSQYSNNDETFTIASYLPDILIEPEDIIQGKVINNNDLMSFMCNNDLKIDNRKPKVNNFVRINGIPLKCIAKVNTKEFDIAVSFNTYKQIVSNELETRITYVYSKNSSSEIIEKLNKTITDKYHPIEITKSKIIKYNFFHFISQTKDIFSLLFISAINYIFIYNFLIKRRMYTYSILQICGLSRYKMFISMLKSMSVLYINSFLISGIIFIYLKVIYFSNNFDLIIKQLFYSFWSILFLNIIWHSFVTIRMIKKTPISLYRESVVM